MVLSRRRFLTEVAAIGGMGAAFLSMQALGLASIAFAKPAPMMPAKIGNGTHVVILGAGIAGLVMAYRLERAGFSVTMVEARRRTGGRNWTLRHGDKVAMIGESEQTVGFSNGMYFNAGPARIPSHHQGLLGYCKLLGVPLEVEVNFSDSALLQSDGAFDGKPIQERQAINDFRGRTAELLSKATNLGALDRDLTADDKERLVTFLRDYGDLSKDNLYKGSDRAGYKVFPGAYDQIGVSRDPLSLRDLLKDDALDSMMFDQNIDMQATMFEPVGGMDRIPAAFQKSIKSPIVLGAEVIRIRQSPEKTEIIYRSEGNGSKLIADYIVCTIPLPVLARIDNDFSAPVKQAIAGAHYDHAAKVAFESPRFWEAEQIYGGLSFGGTTTGAVWYPSSGYQSARGIILGAYVAGKPAEAFEALPVFKQIDLARNAIDKLHPGHAGDLGAPVAVDWSRIPYSLGPWIRWKESGSDPDPEAYRLLNQPEGRVYFSGAHLSQLPSWQEGAVLAAHRTIELIAGRVGAATSTAKRQNGPSQ